MFLDEAIRTFTKIKKGVYTNFIYQTEVPVKAAFKDSVRIVKFCKATGRFGIKYGNLKSVKEKEVTGKSIKKNLNKEWVLKDIVEYNKNTDKFYLNVYASPNKNKYIYVITENGVTRTATDLFSVKECVQNSYLNKRCDTPKEFYKINLENVLKVF